MMYFFQLTEGDQVAPDLDGSDLPDLHAAESVALKAIGELMAEAVAKGERDYKGVLTVEDGYGDALLTLSFASPVYVAQAEMSDLTPQTV